MTRTNQLLACLAVISWSAFSTADPTVITLPSGAVLKGNMSSIARQFLGIPYAAPPVGSLRWVDPQPAPMWPGVLNATNWGPGCPQICDLPPHTCPPVTSEDCLTLNIYTPLNMKKTNNQLAPVFVFIHGGNFKQGYGGGPLYDGSFQANLTGHVYVTINYRLGALAALTGTGSNSLHGNYAIADQRFSLQWLKTNIAAFGGDPNRIVIYGQSAGAASVACHLLSPKSNGLFVAAIMESEPFGIPLRSTDDAVKYSNGFARLANCQTVDNVQCLLQLSVDDVISAQAKAEKDPLLDPNLLEIFMPTTPHYGPQSELPAQPFDAFRGGFKPSVPVIHGVTHDEAVVFIYQAFTKPVPRTEYDLLLTKIFGLKASLKIMQKYPVPSNATDCRPYAHVVATHGIFICPNRNVTRSMAAKNASNWMYIYDHVMTFSEAAWGPNYTYCDDYVCHGSELPFIFYSPWFPAFDIHPTSDEAALGVSLIQYWSNLVNGNPNGQGMLNWPQSTFDNTKQMYFQTPGNTIADDYLADYCNYWDNVVGYNWAG